MARLPDSAAGDDHQGYTLAFADLNADKIPDLFRVGAWHVDDGGDNLFGAYAGSGGGEFALSVEVRLPYRGESRLADVNGDSRPDLIASDGAQNLLVFLNTSSR